MNILIEHIQYLLRRHDCVIIPGIGALIASYRAARICDSQEGITPPYRTICFNAAITNNDGLIATSIARREGISFEAAREKTERLCTLAQQKMAQDGMLELDGIGTLHMGEEDNISFLPSNAFFTPAFYGLQPLTIPTLQQLQIQRQQIQEQQESMLRAGQTYMKDPRYFYLKLRKSVVRAAACLLVATTVGTALWHFIPSTHIIDTASIFPIPSKTENVQKSATTPQVVVKKANKEATKQAPVVEQPAKEEAVAPVAHEPESGKYYLIVASTPNQAEIERFLDLNKDDKSLQIVQTRTMIRVYSEMSADRNELLTAMRDADFHARYPEAWIWQAK